jgi:hypothetical protein
MTNKKAGNDNDSSNDNCNDNCNDNRKGKADPYGMTNKRTSNGNRTAMHGSRNGNAAARVRQTHVRMGW